MARFFTGSDRATAHTLYGSACVYCGRPSDHLDHLVPWSRGGRTVLSNCRPACTPCGSAKSDRDPREWLGDRCPHALAIAAQEEWPYAEAELASRAAAAERTKREMAAAAERKAQAREAFHAPWQPPVPTKPPPAPPPPREPHWVPGPGGPGGRTPRRRRPTVEAASARSSDQPPTSPEIASGDRA